MKLAPIRYAPILRFLTRCGPCVAVSYYSCAISTALNDLVSIHDRLIIKLGRFQIVAFLLAVLDTSKEPDFLWLIRWLKKYTQIWQQKVLKLFLFTFHIINVSFFLVKSLTNCKK
jgi:hypothetical protein